MASEYILGFIDSLFTIGLDFKSLVVSLGKYTNLISLSLLRTASALSSAACFSASAATVNGLQASS